MNLYKKNKYSPFLVAALSFWTAQTVAATVDYEVSAGAGYSDNIARTETLEVEETAALVGLKLEAEHESRALNWELISDLEYRDYLDGTYDAEIVGSLRGGLDIEFVPETFVWVVDNSFGTLQSDPFQAETPDNRENANRFATGPDVRLRFGSNAALEVGGRYYKNDFEVSDTDHGVVQGKVALVSALSAHRTISLNASADRYEFDESELYPDYDRQLVYLGLVSEMSRGSLSVALGVNEIEDLAGTTDGTLIDINVERNFGSSSILNLAFRQGLTDVGELLGDSGDLGISFGQTLRASTVSDPFEHRLASASLEFGRSGNNWYIGAWSRSDEYLNLILLDNERTGLRASIDRTFGRAWQFRLSGSFQRIEFTNTTREDDDLDVLVGLSRQMTRRVRIDVDFGRFRRESTVVNASYVENVARIRLAYGTID